MLFLDHALAVAELHTAILEANQAGELELLTLDSEPTCWRGYAGVGVLKPDSFVRFGIGVYEYSVFIEVDRGTEGSRALLTKLGQYAAYHRSGVEQAENGVFPKVLWTVLDETRAAVLRDCFDQLPPTERELFEVAVFSEALAVLTRGET